MGLVEEGYQGCADEGEVCSGLPEMDVIRTSFRVVGRPVDGGFLTTRVG